MEKRFVRTSHLKPGRYVLVDEQVCQVKDLDISKPGKHGASKARITAIGVFDDVKRTLMQSATDDAESPIIDRGTAPVVADLGARLQIMDTASYQTFDLPKPKDISGLKAGDEVEYIKCEEKIRIVRKK